MDAMVDSDVTGTGEASSARPNILAQLWQKRIVFAVTFCATLLLALAILFVLPVTYLASGSVIVADREPLMGSSSPAWVQKIGDPADMESNILLIRSPRLLRMLVGEQNIPAAIEADCQAASRQLLARLHTVDCSRLLTDQEAQLGWVADRYGVGAVGRSRVISIGYKSPVPEIAQIMVNGLLQTFLDDEHTKLLHTRDEAVDWVRLRLQQLDGELRSDEASIEEFRNAHGLVRGISGPLTAERLTQAAQQLSEAKAAEAEATLRLQETRSGGASSSRMALDSRAIADLKQQLATAGAQAESAAQHLGANNPQLQQFRGRQAELQARLAVETARIADSAKRNVDAAHARVVSAQEELTRRTEAASQAAEAETQIASMVRELETKRGQFVDMSQRLSQLETERRILEPSTQLVNMAELPSRPAFPQKTPFLVGGLTLALVMATAAGLLTYKPAQPGPLTLGRNYMRVPILGQVPELRLRRQGKRELLGRGKREFPLAAAISLLDTHPPLLESVRIVHARLTLLGFGTRRQTLMIASEMEDEGKTFVTLSLARLARSAGRRVLVIETSLRQPFLEEALHGPPSAGLAGYLRGGTPDIVQLGAVPGVDFLLAGDSMADSTELLSGPRFPLLLEWAKHYDLVLIDSAPVGGLMDAALLAPNVEGILFCLRAGRQPVVGGLNSLPEMQRDNGNVVGLVMTFVPDDRMPSVNVGYTPKVEMTRHLQTGHA